MGACLDLGDVENVVDQGQQVLRALVDVGGIALVLRAAERAQQLALHDFREADDGVQRRAQLMAHVGQELRLGAVGELGALLGADQRLLRSEEHTSELQSLMRISYAVFCLKKKQMTTQQD